MARPDAIPHDAGPTPPDPVGTPPPPRIVLTIEEAARWLGIGRTLMYSLVMSGEVESVTIGRLRRVPVECLNEYVANLRASVRQTKSAA